MRPDGKIKLVSELLDLPIVDRQGVYWGIVDDVEFSGSKKEGYRTKALLVGPGAYSGRLPRWAMAIVRIVAGDRITRIAWEEIDTIGPAVKLKRAGPALGLGKTEERAARWLPRKGAL